MCPFAWSSTKRSDWRAASVPPMGINSSMGSWIGPRACGARKSADISMISETDLIQRFFRGLGASRADVLLGIGDDAALLRVAAGEELVLTTDAQIERV